MKKKKIKKDSNNGQRGQNVEKFSKRVCQSVEVNSKTQESEAEKVKNDFDGHCETSLTEITPRLSIPIFEPQSPTRLKSRSLQCAD